MKTKAEVMEQIRKKQMAKIHDKVKNLLVYNEFLGIILKTYHKILLY